jgi:hypothetical protein
VTVPPYLPSARGGDLIFFDGADARDVVSIVTDVVSNGIAVLTRSNLTHVAMVLEPSLPIDGRPQTSLNLIESTILAGKSGPQINPAEGRIQSYEGRVFLARLRERTRVMLDWNAVWDYLLGRIGTDHYSIKTIFDYLARAAPVLGRLPLFYRPEAKAEVCSEYLAAGFRAGGFPGIHPHVDCPQTLAEWAIYEHLDQLRGRPAAIRNFNSV